MLLDTATLDGRARYQLLTSLVVPRPIAWISTWSADGRANLAPFSYFAALSSTPLLVGVSIGSRGGVAKDTLRNLRQTGALCVNFVSEGHLEAMNQTSGEWPPEVDEFERAGVARADSDRVDAPYVATAPAVLECRVEQEVPLRGSSSTLVVGEVLQVRLAEGATLLPGTHFVDAAALHPVARLWGDLYALLGDTPELPRPGR